MFHLYRLCLFIVVFCVWSTPSAGQSVVPPKAEKGVLDLRDWEFSDGSVPLTGEWEFYWEQLIYTFEYEDNRRVNYRKFPKLWKNDTIAGNIISPEGFATHRLRVILNSVTPELTLSIPPFYSAYLLFVNNEYVAANGQVGISDETSNPHWLQVTHDLKVTNDTLDLVLQISNFKHYRGGAIAPILIGDRTKMRANQMTQEANDLVMSSSLFFVGLFFLVLFWFGRQEKQIFYYALFCLFYSYRPVGSGSYLLHTLAPNIPWLITLKLEYATMFLSALFFSFYTYHLYKKETSKFFLLITSLFFGVSILVTLLTPANVFTHLVFPFSVFVFGMFIYLFYTYFLAVKAEREGSKLSLLSSSVLFIVIGATILEYFDVMHGTTLFYFFGFQQFFFIQSIILFYRYNRTFEIAKEKAELAAKSQADFLSMISHEIRTPLNAVIGLTNFLIGDKPKKTHLDDLKTLKFSAEHLHVLINDVLDYSKLDAGKIEFDYVDTNIKEVVKNIVKGLDTKAKEKNIYLNLLMDDDIPRYVVCDSLRLSQVLTNLLGNALKFTNKGGVTLSLTKIHMTPEKVAVKFIIEDSGIGIPKDKIEEIFESFSQASTSTTRQFGGTGLGLSITKRILDLQNTKINVFSIEGQGSRFYFTQTFPISESQERKKLIIEPDQNQLKGKRILLVEDNPVNVMVAKKFLSRWDMHVDVAENGRESIEKVVGATYDLILMDLQMPVMDGYTAAAELRKNKVKIPILALTASVMLDVGDKVYKAGMDDFITKPFDPNELYSKILLHIEKAKIDGD